jgi:Ca2+-binding RTX toxin-like protein
MATSFEVNKADLAFILKQIQISNLHAGTFGPAISLSAAIQQVYGISASDAALSPFGLRTVDGQDNNLLPGQTEFGVADNPFVRLVDPVFINDADGDTMPLGPAGSGAPVVTNTNYGTAGSIADADPRIISNLIVNMTVSNPAAVTAFLNNPLSVAAFEEALGFAPTQAWLTDPANTAVANAQLATIPNQSPDIGLSPGFNAWMTFFGQFFDHGLDLVTKGGNGTVYIPLQVDDPLYVPGSNTNFMALSRATVTLDANGVPQHENTTTSFVDQNQTYTSHASHQVFLREYVKDANGHAVSTGKLLDGKVANGSLDGAMGNWTEVKAQALAMLGILLTDFDVHNVPLLKTDQYGRFIPGANGFAQIAIDPDGVVNSLDETFVEGTASGLLIPANAIRTGHAFLNDIAHHAAPGFVDDHNPATTNIQQVADSDTIIGDDGNALTYDDESLNSHFVTGDGRGNENIALTTVHSIFHSEHNRLVEANKATILAAAAAGDIAFLNKWLLVDVAAVPGNTATLVWDGEKLFQAARFVTEMQYQHLVFEEFARRVQPNVDPFVFTNSADVDPSILAEFAHVVYRFGHSMLTGTVDRLENDLTTVNGAANQATLIEAFLNPQMYIGSGTTLEAANGAIIRGLTRDVANEMDEFIVSDVRSNLLGLPLDLAALNIARARDTGVPSLNNTRAQLYNDFGSADLKPYTSWVDYAQHIKNPSSIINFIAAYGTHAELLAADVNTVAEKRAVAMALVMGGSASIDGGTRIFVADQPDRLAFLNATGTYAGGNLGGLNLVDLWIGGLAEEKNEFGGMLGSTFNFVFEYQMEHLQNGDRLYYLSRTQGLNLLNHLEPNTFTDLVMRNTDLGDIYATHLNGALFVTPDHILELDPGIAQDGADPVYDDLFQQAIDPKVVRITGTDLDDNGHFEGGLLKFSGGEHVVLGGTEGNDTLLGDKGIDVLWGDGGNDYLNAGMESDDVFGGDGDDIIEDPFGDDVLRGNQGNDVISGGVGIDLLFGDQGVDYIIMGQDAAGAFAGDGNDFILGGVGKDVLFGNEGDDWMEGGDGFDLINGENSELFFNSPIIGHDVLWGQGNDQDYDAESGDDIMLSGPGIQRFEGMFGFDWGIAKFDPGGARFDLQIPIFTTIPTDVLRDRFDQVEGLSGWKHSDVLDGDDRGHKGGGSSAPDSVPTELFVEHVLTQEGIDRITGLKEWMDGARQTLFGAGVPGAQQTSYRDGNILMGGDGSDFLRGRGGYDLLDGDAWLNVRIDIDMGNLVHFTAESMNTDVSIGTALAGKVYDLSGNVQFGGRSLNSLMLDRTLNPGRLSIVREILTDLTPNDNDDTAIFQGTLAEYEIEGRVTDGANGSGNLLVQAHDVNGDGFISVRDKDTGAAGAIITDPDGQPLQLTSSRGALTDDTDLIKNIEMLRFADATIVIGGTNQLATGTVEISDPTPFSGQVTPYVGQVLTASLSGVADADGLTFGPNGLPAGLTFQWQTTETGGNTGWATIQTSNTYTVRSVDPGHILRAVAVFKDADGATETITSAATAGALAAFRVDENSASGTVVAAAIPFNPDYDPDSSLGGATDGDIVTLTHVMNDSAGGRFQVVTVGGVQQIQVLNGGNVNLNYEAINEFQIVIDSYTDTIANGGLLLAKRQFTVFLNDVDPEVVVAPPPSGGTANFGSGPDSLVLKISQDAYLGSAQYDIAVDGLKINSTPITAAALHSSGLFDTVTVLGNWTGNHAVSVSFLNDVWGGTAATDRNLYVDGITFKDDAAAAPSVVSSTTTALTQAGTAGFNFTDGVASAPLVGSSDFIF